MRLSVVLVITQSVPQSQVLTPKNVMSCLYIFGMGEAEIVSFDSIVVLKKYGRCALYYNRNESLSMFKKKKKCSLPGIEKGHFAALMTCSRMSNDMQIMIECVVLCARKGMCGGKVGGG